MECRELFKIVRDTFVKDRNGNTTSERVVCLKGYGYVVHITFPTTSKYIHVSVNQDREIQHGRFFPNIFIRYNGIIPEKAVADFPHVGTITVDEMDEFAEEISRAKGALLAFDGLLKDLPVLAEKGYGNVSARMDVVGRRQVPCRRIAVFWRNKHINWK